MNRKQFTLVLVACRHWARLVLLHAHTIVVAHSGTQAGGRLLPGSGSTRLPLSTSVAVRIHLTFLRLVRITANPKPGHRHQNRHRADLFFAAEFQRVGVFAQICPNLLQILLNSTRAFWYLSSSFCCSADRMRSCRWPPPRCGSATPGCSAPSASALLQLWTFCCHCLPARASMA